MIEPLSLLINMGFSIRNIGRLGKRRIAMEAGSLGRNGRRQEDQ
jgi:hypothetical protein